MTLDQIRYFIELCHTLNFTRAAENLYVSQSSLSKQISKLEEELQVGLVERNSRKVVLTPAGIIFYQEFSRILSEADNAVFKVKNAGRKIFRLAVFQPFSSHDTVRNILQQTNVLQGDYELHIYLMKYGEIQGAYRSHTADLFIIPSTLLPVLNIAMDPAESRILTTLPQAFVYTRQLYDPADFSIDKLNGHKFLALDTEYSGGNYQKELSFLAQHGCVPSKVQKTGDILNTIRYIDPSDSFSIVYDLAKKDADGEVGKEVGGKEEQGLCYSRICDEAFSSQLLAVWHKDCQQTVLSYIHALLEQI